MNEIIESLYQRKSVRAYEDRAIPEEMKNLILEAAMQAPMVLVFCADCKKWYDAYLEAGCKPRKPGVGDLMLSITDTAIAAQNAVVAAEAASEAGTV